VNGSHWQRRAWHHELPFFLQQGSDAADMQAMLVDPSSCGRGGYILAKASAIFNSFTGFREGALDDIDGAGKSDRYFFEGCEKLIARAIEQGKVSNSDTQYLTTARLSRLSRSPAHPRARSPSFATALRKLVISKLDRQLAEPRRECRLSVSGRSASEDYGEIATFAEASRQTDPCPQ
jgi:hypothetical protein